MQVGNWNKLPHYSVCGDATCLYVWINEDGRGSNTEWIKGREAFDLWHKFAKLEKSDKKGFVALAKCTFELHRKVTKDVPQTS